MFRLLGVTGTMMLMERGAISVLFCITCIYTAFGRNMGRMRWCLMDVLNTTGIVVCFPIIVPFGITLVVLELWKELGAREE